MIWTPNGLYNALVKYAGDVFASRDRQASARHTEVLTALGAIRVNQEKEMTDINKIKDDETAELNEIEGLKSIVTTAVTGIATGNALVAEQSKTIQELRDKIAANQPVTKEDLDGLDAGIVSGTSSIQKITADLKAALAPAAPPADNPPADNPPA